MDQEKLLTRTFLPLLVWHGQKAGLPSGWARTLIPPPDNIVRIITKELGQFNSPALASPSCRREVRRQYQAVLEARFKEIYSAPRPLWDDVMALLGVVPDSKPVGQPRTLKEIETQTKAELTELEEHHEELEKALPFLAPGRAHDVVTLLTEFSLNGETQTKPKIRTNSAIWRILGVRPEQLEGLSPRVVALTILTAFLRLFGLIGPEAREEKLRQFFDWVIKWYLPRDREKPHSPEALAKAVMEGLIYRGYEFKEDEYSEPEVEVRDPKAEALLTNSLEETRNELRRLMERVSPPFTKAERCIFDGMVEGKEGTELKLWAEAHGVSHKSVPELRSRVLLKLRKAART